MRNAENATPADTLLCSYLEDSLHRTPGQAVKEQLGRVTAKILKDQKVLALMLRCGRKDGVTHAPGLIDEELGLDHG
jgi:hypothetical protein